MPVPKVAAFDGADRSQESAETSPVAAVPEKVLYPSVCATCGIEIEVPFQPDASRPTFCKDCLRDYQRAVARERNQEVNRRERSLSPPHGSDRQPKERYRHKRTSELRAYAPSEQPMKLSQTQYIEPKKFKALRKKPDINVSAVRALIDGARQGKDIQA